MIDGIYKVILRLYSDQNGMQSVWQDAMNAQTTNGVFSITLGGGAMPLPMNAMNTPLWLGVQPDGQDEMKPLTALTASPFALAIPNGSVTAEKMGTPYVGGIYINGVNVTDNGGALNITGSDGALTFDAATNSLTLNATAGISSGKDGDKTQAVGFAAFEGNDANTNAAKQYYLTEWSTKFTSHQHVDQQYVH